MNFDLVLLNGWVLDAAESNITKQDIGITSGRISFLGNISKIEACGAEKLDIKNKLVIPGLIDCHTHHEMSLLSLTAFSEVVLKKGTTTIILDPHDTVSVLGIEGLDYLIEESKNLPIRIFFTVPPCAPASLDFDESKKTVKLKDIKRAFFYPQKVLGLAEIMDIKRVLEKEPELLEMAGFAKFGRKIIDGHMPGLHGTDLIKYLNATCALTDHESGSVEEALEKNELGIFTIIRRGSLEKEFSAAEFSSKAKQNDKTMLATDGCVALQDILRKGHMNFGVKELIREGVSIGEAIKMAAYNSARVYGLENQIGDVKPGLFADLVVLKNLESFEPEYIVANGALVDNSLFNNLSFRYPPHFLKTIDRDFVTEECFKIKTGSEMGNICVRAIEIVSGTLLTKEIPEWLFIENSEVLAAVHKDILKAAIFSRSSEKYALGFVRGFGFKRGAFAGSIAQDSQHIIVVGADGKDMAFAVNEIIRRQGALLFVENKKVIAALDLPLAGIMSLEKPETVCEKLDKINYELVLRGCRLRNPYTALSWQMSIPSIPGLKITVKGLVENGKNIVNLFN